MPVMLPHPHKTGERRTREEERLALTAVRLRFAAQSNGKQTGLGPTESIHDKAYHVILASLRCEFKITPQQ
jgi:hypothetical protein